MTATVSALWRYPIKAVGREAVDSVDLIAGETFPGDRLWAVAHEKSQAVDGEWSRCVGFIRGASSPLLQAVTLRQSDGLLHLSHPDRPELSVDPDADPQALLDWLRPLIAERRAAPVRVVRAPAGRGMTDTSDPTITLAGRASLDALSERAEQTLSMHRWRSNIWIDGTAPWEEFDWVGRPVRIGAAVVEPFCRVDRCQMTSVNPETGVRDMNTLGLLKDFGHQDFSVGVRVTQGGTVRPGDAVVPA